MVCSIGCEAFALVEGGFVILGERFEPNVGAGVGLASLVVEAGK